MKRRSGIRVASFLLAAFAGLIAWAGAATARAHAAERELAVSRQRALTELANYTDGIETALQKCVYSAGGAFRAALTAELRGDAAGAKSSLNVLSAGDDPLFNIYKFLSQVGEYAESLQKKTADGARLGEEDRANVKKLLGYARGLSRQFAYMTELMEAGSLTFDELKEGLESADDASESTVSFIGAVADAEETITDYPTLIYDGPFSDNVLNKTSALLEQAEEVTLSEARRIAANAAGAEEAELLVESETGGKLAAYAFRYDGTRIAVTKRGGYVAYTLSDRGAGVARFSGRDAVQKGAEFLKKLGYADMRATYFASNDGVCTVNYAYVQNGWICYPDLIKVSVSLSDGSVTALDASDYLMNHVRRTVPEPVLDEAAAAAAVSDALTVKQTRPTVVPVRTGGERFAYEQLCEDDAGQDVLVYVDTQTGEEADILLLLYADNGTLTK